MSTIHALVEAQVRRTPDAVALEFEGEELTYRDMDRRANRLAHALRRRGAGPETVVAVGAQRSVDLVVSLLGILKSGAAYLPLDLELPDDRLSYMVRQTGAVALVRGPGMDRDLGVPDLPEVSPAGTSDEPDESCGAAVDERNTAYIMYTSGSTGRPKGVVVEHRGVCNRLRWGQYEYGMTSDERVLQKTPYAFDVSVHELFWPLIVGARLVIARPGGHRDTGYLVELIQRREITSVHFIPTMLALFIGERGVGDCRSLRRVLASGEALPPDVQNRALRVLPHIELHNLYGPTEASIEVSAWQCRPDWTEPGVPIGSAVTDTQLHILDDELAPIPGDGSGELYLAGVQLARGYHGQPGLTAERFLPDPFGAPGSRMYRSGDLAAWHRPGVVDYLGRADEQLKLAGNRVELGEIQTVLNDQPGVRTCVVVAAGSGADQRLVAYVVAAGDGLDPQALRSGLAGLLPAYMVPSTLVELPELPLTNSGKLDRKALPPPGRPDLPVPYRAPQDAVQERLAGVWASVFGVGHVGVDDPFIALGGHSLLAVRLVARLRDEAGAHVSVRDLFEGLTIAELAARATGADGRDGTDGRNGTEGADGRDRTEGADGRDRTEGADGRDRTGVGPGPGTADVTGTDGTPGTTGHLHTGHARPVGHARRPRDTDGAAARPAVAPADGSGEPVVPSFAQERLLFLQHLHPDSATYVIPVAWRLEGRLDETVLHRSLERLAARHDALRTRFPGVDSPPVIEPAPAVDLRRVDAQEWNDDLVAAEIGRPFDLAAGPAWRTVLIRLPQHDVLLLMLHHLVADGWSLGVIARELGALYAGDTSPPPPVRYADFARRQRAALTERLLADQSQWWCRTLAGAPALELPTDRPRPAVLGTDGATHRFPLPQEALRRLTRRAQDEGATLHTVLLTAYQVLLGRWSGQTDFVVGIPAAGRTSSDVDDVVGLFVNTLAVRADLSGDPTLAQLLRRVREAGLGGYEHQDVPFERVVEDLRPERDLSRAPVFQTMFAVRDSAATALRLPGMRAEEIQLGWRTSKFDLTLFVEQAADGSCTGLIEYATALFEPATAQRMADGYRRLLVALAEHGDGRLSDWDVLDTASRDRLVRAGSAPRPALPERCLHQLVADQAASHRSRPAVVDGTTVWTYAELDRRANRLAWCLRALGAGPERAVAVALPRSAELVMAQLAVLKAGGAYVPLDPEQPAERSRYVIEETGADLLVTTTGYLSLDGLDGLDCRVVDVARVPEETRALPDTAPEVGVHPDNLGFVVHTSGSTGRPKGIGLTHRGLVRTVREGGYADLRPDDRVAFAANPVFDAATFEVWAPLVAGATIVVTPPEVALSPTALAGHLAHHRVTTLFLTTALFNQVVRERPDALRGLRHVLFGGEAADPQAVDALLADPPGQLLHMYGPAECTTFATWHRVTEPAGDRPVPIGRALHNTTAFVVDELLRPVPVGVVGELVLGGAGLARCYPGKPGLTAERFVPDPFGPPGGRLYRTGDLVRWTARDRLEFVGRADGQVKVRGFRVEPGEIETVAHRHPAVREAVVVARPDRSGALALILYVVGEDVDPADLRAHLGACLPAYLVPAAVVPLGELPLTRNGKVNRAVLPEPVYPSGSGRGEPANELEHLLADAFAEVLGIDRPGMDDDFFALGGHSLLAIKLATAVAERTGRQMTFRDLFRTRTVAALADLLGHADATGAPIERSEGTSRLPVSFGQERLVFMDFLEGAGPAYTIPLAWRLTGPLDRNRLADAFDTLVARHEMLRARFTLVDGVAFQDVDPGWAGVEWREAHSVEEAGRAVGELAREPFDLVTGPLFRVVVHSVDTSGNEPGSARDRQRRQDQDADPYQDHPREHVLTVVMHHAISDGWSTAVLIRELEACYAGEPLPEPPLRYADFAAWQRRELTAGRLAGRLAHWRRRLADLPTLELPTDRPRPAVRHRGGGVVEFTVEPELVAELEALGQRQGATLFMTLLAAYQTLLGRWSGQTDFAVGTPVAGRDRPEVRDVVGFFLNTLVLRADLSADPTFDELLARVRDDALDAYEHQEMPFGRLVEELSPERDLSRSPLFQAMFSYNDWNLDTLRLGTAHGTALPVDRGAAKLDLTLELVRGPGGLTGTIDFTTDIFDPPTIARMARAYTTLLGAVAAGPGTRIGELPLAAAVPAPAGAVVPARATAAIAARETPSLLDRIAEQVRAAPEKTAVISGTDRVTYARLDRLANRLAHRLVALGVGPETRVGLGLPRGIDAVVAVLGIWKAGGAFVGLDPDQPERRRRLLGLDAGIRLVVDRDLLADPALDHCPAHAPDAPRAPEQLAYTVYTSGSTGTPKGVLVEQAGIAAHLDASLAHYRLDRDDVVLQRASTSFDAFLRDCIGPLTVGATVLMAGQSDLSALGTDAPDAPAPTAILSMVPSLLHQLLDGGDLTARRLPGLRLLVLSGEPCTPALLARLHTALPGLRRVVNQYGPTECTLTTTFADLDPAVPCEKVTVGRPMPGTAVHVLDPALRPQPVGVYGELYISGRGVTRGYHDRPGLTAQAFVPDPSGPPGARMYRTGDAGRLLADGTLELRGRMDRQVKVRGVRIEPAEVEQALAAQPGVGAAAVTARPDGANGSALTGYVQRAPGAAVSVAELRAGLEATLPYAMIPAELMVLDALPLLGNGKVDRSALPEATAGEGGGHIAPRTTTEKTIAEIWAELLGRPDIGVEDDFFALGGHSLTAMRVISRLRSQLDTTISLRAFFEARTVAGLARTLLAQEPKGTTS
ncbi:amino acid adenylation domain-containing protein [Streptomyces sp. NPDC048514]|uniref:amino acid adenylation domain-containing protein n=1 Tax=Streptomyces sp. NPDC048514 TaxID=3365564 RepID=UPI003710775A